MLNIIHTTLFMYTIVLGSIMPLICMCLELKFKFLSQQKMSAENSNVHIAYASHVTKPPFYKIKKGREST